MEVLVISPTYSNKMLFPGFANFYFFPNSPPTFIFPGVLRVPRVAPCGKWCKHGQNNLGTPRRSDQHTALIRRFFENRCLCGCFACRSGGKIGTDSRVKHPEKLPSRWNFGWRPFPPRARDALQHSSRFLQILLCQS